MLLIGIGVGGGVLASLANHPATPPTTLSRAHTRSVPAAYPTPKITSILPPISPYPKVTKLYCGTIHDIPTDTTTNISLKGIQQQGNISGYFAELYAGNLLKGIPENGSFRGAINTAKRIQFVVTSGTGQITFSFDGLIQPDGTIGGTYCSSELATEKCSDYGVWSVSPGA